MCAYVCVSYAVYEMCGGDDDEGEGKSKLNESGGHQIVSHHPPYNVIIFKKYIIKGKTKQLLFAHFHDGLPGDGQRVSFSNRLV